jgi:hypothetical protein
MPSPLPDSPQWTASGGHTGLGGRMGGVTDRYTLPEMGGLQRGAQVRAVVPGRDAAAGSAHGGRHGAGGWTSADRARPSAPPITSSASSYSKSAQPPGTRPDRPTEQSRPSLDGRLRVRTMSITSDPQLLGRPHKDAQLRRRARGSFRSAHRRGLCTQHVTIRTLKSSLMVRWSPWLLPTPNCAAKVISAGSGLLRASASYTARARRYGMPCGLPSPACSAIVQQFVRGGPASSPSRNPRSRRCGSTGRIVP